MRASCNVFFLKREVYVAAAAMTTHGFEIDAEPVCKLADEISDVALGASVLSALGSYVRDVAPPGPKAAANSSPVLRIAGFKSWSDLEHRSRNVFVVREDGKIRAVPTSRQSGGGFSHRNDLAIESGPTPEEVGKAVMGAASLSE